MLKAVLYVVPCRRAGQHQPTPLPDSLRHSAAFCRARRGNPAAAVQRTAQQDVEVGHFPSHRQEFGWL